MRIVEDDNFLVFGELDIEFKRPGAVINRKLKSRQCIFRGVRTGTSVCKNDRRGEGWKHLEHQSGN